MATAAKSNSPSSSTKPGQSGNASRSMGERLMRGIDAVYRFLASVKLAVLSIGALAATLAYATFFEKDYGTAAVNEYIYRGPGFAILLAFLGVNILCAALIRFPWKKRQTGFVITHAGLLILLAGSYYSVRTSDEGQVGMLEGDVRDELVRIDHPVIRVWEIDPHTRERLSEYDVPFLPGAFSWGPGRPRPLGLFERIHSMLPGSTVNTSEVPLTSADPFAPFRMVAKAYYSASAPATEHIEAENGTPMARIRLRFKAPGMPQEQDAFPTEDSQWFVTESKFYRAVREPMRAAPALITFAAVDRPELVQDFLKPPTAKGPKGVARIRYPDKSGQTKVHDWPLDDQAGKTITLPDSDLSVTLSEVLDFPTQTRGLDRVLGSDPIPIALFKIKKGTGEPVTHMAMANLPSVPNVIPSQERPSEPPPSPLASIHYIVTPTIDPKVNGRFGEIDVLAMRGTSKPTLYYRVYGRAKDGGLGDLRSSGPLATGKPMVAFGGTSNMPMTISFEVDDYLASGVERDICIPVELPVGKMDQGVGACRVAMSVGDQTKDIWLRRSLTLDPPRPETLTFGDRTFALAFDADRKPLGFEIKLDDFEVGFEPGTEQATKFESKVRLTDKAAGINDQPHKIWMNHPLDHNGYTFYQMRYQPDIDPHTERPTGRFLSVFQVATNPGRPIIYLGCLLVVIGTFAQFYMRAGVFTDGGKRERALAEAAALGKKPAKPERERKDRKDERL